MAFNRNITSNTNHYHHEHNINTSGPSQYSSTRRNDDAPQKRQNYVPEIRQDYIPPRRHDYDPPTRQDYVPPARHEYSSSIRQDYINPIRQENTLQARQNYIHSPRQDYGRSRQDYVEHTRDEYTSFRQDFDGPGRRNYGPQESQHFGYDNNQISGSQNRQESHRQSRENYDTQSRQGNGSQGGRNYSPPIRRNSISRQDYIPHVPDYDSQSRLNYWEDGGNNSQSQQSSSSNDYTNESQRSSASFSFIKSQKEKYDRGCEYPDESRNLEQNINRTQYTNEPSTSQSSATNVLSRDTDSGEDSLNQQSNNKFKKFKKPLQQKYHCTTCNKALFGLKAYNNHMNGLRHKTNEKLDKERGKTQRDPEKSGYLQCPLCETFCSDEFSYKTHVRGSKHRKLVMKYTNLKKPIPDCDVDFVRAKAQKLAVPIGQEFIEKDDESPDADEVLCRACNVRLNEKGIESHCKTIEHRKNYNWKLRELEEESTSQNLENRNDSGPFDVDDASFWEEIEKVKKIENAGKSQGNDGEQSNVEESSKISQIQCEICNLSFADECLYSIHVRGSRHRKKMRHYLKFQGK